MKREFVPDYIKSDEPTKGGLLDIALNGADALPSNASERLRGHVAEGHLTADDTIELWGADPDDPETRASVNTFLDGAWE